MDEHVRCVMDERVRREQTALLVALNLRPESRTGLHVCVLCGYGKNGPPFLTLRWKILTKRGPTPLVPSLRGVCATRASRPGGREAAARYKEAHSRKIRLLLPGITTLYPPKREAPRQAVG